MPRRPKVLQKRIFVVLLVILVVALPISMAVLFPSGVLWAWILKGGALVQQFIAFLSVFFAWLTRY